MDMTWQQQPQWQPQPIYIQQPRRRPGMSALGLAAIIIGVFTLLGSVVPVCGIFVIPMAILGVVLAGVGFCAAVVSREKGVGVPLLGFLMCGASIVLPFVATGAFLGGLTNLQKMRDDAMKQREAENRSATQRSTTQPAP